MADIQFIHINKRSTFTPELQLKYDKSIVFIKDTLEIYTHGTFYTKAFTKLTDNTTTVESSNNAGTITFTGNNGITIIVNENGVSIDGGELKGDYIILKSYSIAEGTTEEELTPVAGDTISKAIGKLHKVILDNEEVTASALVKLNETSGFTQKGELNFTEDMFNNATSLTNAIEILAQELKLVTNSLKIKYISINGDIKIGDFYGTEESNWSIYAPVSAGEKGWILKSNGANLSPTYLKLDSSDIPEFDASKITSGTIATARLPIASATASGIVNTTTQTFAGAKTFQDGAFDPSDIRYKTNIKDIDIKGIIELKEFDINDRHSFGVIAQLVEELYPSVVKEDSNGYKAVNYNEILSIKCAELEAKNRQLEDKLTRLEKLLIKKEII